MRRWIWNRGTARGGARAAAGPAPGVVIAPAILVLIGIAWLPAGASEADRFQGPPPDGPGMARPAAEEEDGDLVETLEIYMIAKMKRALELSREQEEKIVPLVQSLSEARRKHNHERRLAMMTLRPLVEDPASREEEIRRALARLDQSVSAFREEEARTQQQIRAALTPRQQAQFIFFQERFRHEMQERLRRFHESDAGPGGGPPVRRRDGPSPTPPGNW